MKLPPALTLLFGKLLLNLTDVETVSNQLVGIDLHLVFTRGPAEARYVHYVRNRLELLLEHPVLQGSSAPSGRTADWCCVSVYQ